MPGRFVEYKDEDKKYQFKRKLKERCRKILFYYYSGGIKNWKNLRELADEVDIKLMLNNTNENASFGIFL